MNKDSQSQVTTTGVVRASAHCGAEPAFVLAEGALELPALAEGLLGKASVKSFPVAAADGVLTTVTAGPAAMRGWDDAGYSQVFPAKLVSRLALVAGVGQKLPEGLQCVRLRNRGPKLPMVGIRPLVGNAPEVHVGLRVRDGRKLGKVAFFKTCAASVVLACMAGFIAGGVDGGLFGSLREKASFPRLLECGGYQASEGVFFSSFFSA